MMNHYLTNGNKRLALTFLKGLLWQFGYYLKWTDGMYKNYLIHKLVIEDFVKDLEDKNDEERKDVKKQIKKWIMQNVIIALHWR